MSNQIGGEGSQTGDITTGHAAGRDIDIGASGELLVELVKYQIDKESQFRSLLITAMERQQLQLSKEIRELRIIMIIVAIAFVVLIIVIL